MMKRLAIGLLYALVGYLFAAVVGYFLIERFSPNTHDRALEAAMTSAFVIGPLGAVAAFIAGCMRTSRPP